MICIWFTWCHCHPVISCFIKIQNGLPFWCQLTQVVLEKRLLNGNSSTVRDLPWPQGSNLSFSPSTYSSKQIAHVSYGSPNQTNKQQTEIMHHTQLQSSQKCSESTITPNHTLPVLNLWTGSFLSLRFDNNDIRFLARWHAQFTHYMHNNTMNTKSLKYQQKTIVKQKHK